MSTCPQCGRTDEETFFNPGQSWCRDDTIKWRAAVHSRTSAGADNHNQPWTQLEDEMMCEAESEGMSWEDIAILLGRTYNAAQNRFHFLMTSDHEPVYSTTTTRSTTVTTTTTTTVRARPVCPVCHVVRPCFCE